MVGYPVFWVTSLICMFADLLSKTAVFCWTGPFTVIRGFFEIRCVENTGGIWGIGKGMAVWFAIVRFIALFVILYLLRQSRRSNTFLHFGLGLVFGGAVGNLWDTIVLGAVRDFLEFDLQVMVWPTFNLADSCISVGAFLLFLHFIGGRKKVEGDEAGIEAL